jgi:hypothetical protein
LTEHGHDFIPTVSATRCGSERSVRRPSVLLGNEYRVPAFRHVNATPGIGRQGTAYTLTR